MMNKLITPTPKALVIRVSELMTYRQCRRKWNWQYNEQLGKIDQKIGAREHGTLFHTCLQGYYNGIKDGKSHEDAQVDAWALWAEHSQLMDYTPENLELFSGMLAHYFEKYNAVELGWKILAVEQRYYAKVPKTNVYISGQIDLLVEIPKYGIVIVDFKTWASFWSFEEVQFSTQLTAYIWILKQNGVDVREAWYDMCKKSVPHEPKVLAKGGISKDKSQQTTRSLYLAEIRELGLDVSDYMDFLDNWEEPKFHCREAVSRNKAHLLNFENNLSGEIHEMVAKRTHMSYNYSKECSYCDYKQLCAAMNDGDDYDFIKRTQYKNIELGNAPQIRIS